MRSLALGAALLAVTAAACGSPVPPPSQPATRTTTAPAASSGPSAADLLELRDDAGSLPPGRYRPSGGRPPVTLAVEDGWTGGPVRDGSLAITRALPDGSTVELRIAGVRGLVEDQVAGGLPAQAVASHLQGRRGLRILGASGSRMSGYDGANLELENPTPDRVELLTTRGGSLGIDPGGRLWLSLFDTGDGLLAIAVTSPAASWDQALTTVEPVLESVTIGG